MKTSSTASSSLALHHVSLIVTDLGRSREFYRTLFGFQELKRPAFRTAGAWFAAGSLQLHLIENRSGTFRQRGKIDGNDGHVAFRTADFDAFLSHAKVLGFHATAEPDDPKRLVVNRAGPAGFPQLYLLDPDHNIIEVNGAP